MVEATAAELEEAGITDSPQTVVVDPGYWHTRQMEHVAGRGIQVLIPADSGVRQGTRPGWDKGIYAFMRGVACDRSRAGDLPTADGDRRAGDRPDEVQPRLHPLSATRKIGRALGVALGGRDPQPAQAPHSPIRHRAGLTAPGPTRDHTEEYPPFRALTGTFPDGHADKRACADAIAVLLPLV